MSQENVELVRRVWGIVASRGAEAVLDYFTEDCLMEDFPELPDHAVYVGREGVREIERHFQEMWGEFVQEPGEFTDAGDDLVVGVVAMRGHGKGSGAPLDAQAFWVHELRDGKLARIASIHHGGAVPRSRRAAGVTLPRQRPRSRRKAVFEQVLHQPARCGRGLPALALSARPRHRLREVLQAAAGLPDVHATAVL